MCMFMLYVCGLLTQIHIHKVFHWINTQLASYNCWYECRIPWLQSKWFVCNIDV